MQLAWLLLSKYFYSCSPYHCKTAVVIKSYTEFLLRLVSLCTGLRGGMHTFSSKTATLLVLINDHFKYRKRVLRASVQVQPTDSLNHSSNIIHAFHVFQMLPRIWIFSKLLLLEGLLWD